MPLECDVLVIGGGVIGTAIAARLSQTNARVCLVEKSGDVADGASKGNAGITSSYYAAAGTLEAQLTTSSCYRWEDVCQRLNIPYKRVGALMPALNETEAAVLPGECEQALACGVRAEILSAEEARRREPLISPECVLALSLPDEGIIDPMKLCFGYAELAAHNGADVRFYAPVISMEKDGDRIISVDTPQGTIRARYVVNAAGLHADLISGLAGGDEFRMWPRKGQYWLLDREFGRQLNHIVFATPAVETKGMHVVPTTNGTVLLGPSVQECEDRYDNSTDHETLKMVFESARRLVPSVSLDYAIKSFASLRPACKEPYFVRQDRSVPNLFHAVSRSIGVSTSLGIADYMFDLLQQAGLNAQDRQEPITALPHMPRLRHDPDPVHLSDAGPGFSQIVCVCEQVTAAEIEGALKAKVPARSIDGVRKRTAATGGRCQGSVCMAGVMFMCSVHMDCPPEKVPLKDWGEVGIGRVNHD